MSALPTTTSPKINKLFVTAGYYGAFICLGLSTAALGPTLTSLASNTHSSLDLISSLFIGRSLGYMLGSLIGGRFYDHLPGNRLMAAMLALMAVMIFFVPVISMLWVLVVVMLLLGFGEGAMDTGGNTLLTRIHANNLGPYMNGLHFFFGVGTSITPIIIAQTALRSGQLNWAYWWLALLFIPVIIWLFFQTSPPVQMQASHETKNLQSSRLLIGLIAAFMFLYVGAEVGYASWIYTYTIKLNLGSAIQAAYLTSLFWGAFTVGRLVAIPIAIRVKPQTILFIDLLGSFICIAAILLFPLSTTILWLCTAGIGFFFASIFPTALVLAERRIALTGRTTGFLLVGGSLGGMSVPWLVGQLFEPSGPKVMPFIVCLTILLSFIVFNRLPASSKSSEQAKYQTGPSSE